MAISRLITVYRVPSQKLKQQKLMTPWILRDGPRYRALGNSMAVPVMRMILERIEEVAA